MSQRTMREIAKAYNKRRDEILQRIKEGKVSASMSGIEYYHKPWEDLDMSSDLDADSISTALTWDGKKHTHTGLKRIKNSGDKG